ncbi:uncharacterized protein LTR77_006431 [Saxophila tyrrhenica]|uniref:Uncharacterized protein n=1 Tax=Saxophila tyrrhenica TaxID=1690608 RepID=A0AAV9P8G2_9PEZI|nr:hypothetical protein LTR77_006431 [Saxophila tyrrhenica]
MSVYQQDHQQEGSYHRNLAVDPCYGVKENVRSAYTSRAKTWEPTTRLQSQTTSLQPKEQIATTRNIAIMEADYPGTDKQKNAYDEARAAFDKRDFATAAKKAYALLDKYTGFMPTSTHTKLLALLGASSTNGEVVLGQMLSSIQTAYEGHLGELGLPPAVYHHPIIPKLRFLKKPTEVSYIAEELVRKSLDRFTEMYEIKQMTPAQLLQRLARAVEDVERGSAADEPSTKGDEDVYTRVRRSSKPKRVALKLT